MSELSVPIRKKMIRRIVHLSGTSRHIHYMPSFAYQLSCLFVAPVVEVLPSSFCKQLV